MSSTICSRCKEAKEPHRKHGFCLKCHAKYMRLTRPRHSELSPLAKKKANARSYANVFYRRGNIKKKTCQMCGSHDTQMHHSDYDKPLEVYWLCRGCHLDFHKMQQEYIELYKDKIRAQKKNY